MKVFIAGGLAYKEYINWLPGAERTTLMAEADLVLFAGGEDVSPSIYGELKHPFTSTNWRRDQDEEEVYEQARKLNKPMLGICRGSQFICAKSGGRLVQHQENPYSIHPIVTRDGQELLITSSHHQAQYPYEMPRDEYQLIGWTENISRFHQNGLRQEISATPFKEAEIVYYPKVKALGIQGHPEWMSPKNEEHKETLDYLNKLVSDLLLNNTQ